MQEGDWKEIENVADRLLDKKWIANEKKTLRERHAHVVRILRPWLHLSFITIIKTTF